MTHQTPEALLIHLVEARSRGHVDDALSCYEPEATIVTQPGQVASGPAAVRAVLEFFAASRLTFSVLGRVFLESDGVALHLSSWSMQGLDPDGNELRAAGRSSDVARRGFDGGWLLAVDNPWGTDYLEASTRS